VASGTEAMEAWTRARDGQDDLEAVGLGSLLLPERLGVWSWALGYAAILCSLSVLRYHLWISTGFDLGLYEQGLWLILHHGLRAPTTYTGQPILARGAAWLLLPLAPLYAVGGAGLLLALQSLALGLGYVALRRIGHTLGVIGPSAHLVGIAYLLYPVVLGANLFDFHPVVLAVPALLAGLAATVEGRQRSALIWWAVALLARDTVSLPLLVLGVALGLTGHRRVGAAASAFALVAAFLDGGVLLPRLTHGPYPGLEEALRRGLGLPAGLHPWVWLKTLRAWEYLVWLGGPLLGLAVSARRRLLHPWWLPALAVVAVNLAENTAAATSPFNQFSVLAVPAACAALLAALAGHALESRRQRLVALGPVLLFLAVFTWHEVRTDWRAIPASADSLVAAAATVPANAPVVAQNFALPRLSDRPRAWLPQPALRAGVPRGTYVLLDTGMHTGTTPVHTIKVWLHVLARPGVAQTTFAAGNIRVWRLLRRLPSRGVRP
jgi:hypothetical protein